MTEEFDNELKDLSPMLSDLKKRQVRPPFKTPKFYFDTLTDRVVAEAQKTEKTVPVFSKATPQYPTFFGRLEAVFATILAQKRALAFASCALVFGVFLYVFMQKSNKNALIEPQIIVNQSPYAQQNLPNTTPQITLNSSPSGTKTITLPDVPKAEIDDYLTNNLMDFDQQIVAENDQKSLNTEGVGLHHSAANLTEEEIEHYLAITAEDSDIEGIDN